MRFSILLLLVLTPVLARASSFDSLIRRYTHNHYYYTENDIHRYKLLRQDLKHIRIPGLQPTHYYGGCKLGPNSLFIHFERDDMHGRQAMLVTCDSQFANLTVKRIGLSGTYFNEYDQGRMSPRNRDSSRAYMIIDRILPHVGLEGITVSLHTNYKPYKMTIRTRRNDLWREFYHIGTDGNMRPVPLLEHYARWDTSPLRAYVDTIQYVDHRFHNRGGPFPIESLRPYVPDSLLSRDSIQVTYQYSFALNDAIRIMRLRAEYDQPDSSSNGITDVIITVDKHFRFVDRIVLPLVGRDALSYNNGRMPDERLHIHDDTFTIRRHMKDDATGHFVVNSGSCGGSWDSFGDRIDYPHGWIEYRQVTSKGQFVLDSTKINSCMSVYRPAHLPNFPWQGGSIPFTPIVTDTTRSQTQPQK